MADLASITDVRLTSTTIYEKVTAGASIDPGKACYQDAADSEYKLAQHDGTSAEAAAKGISINPGVDGEPMLLATSGEIVLVGATVAVGQTYVVSANAGEIAVESDVGSGDYMTILGVGVTTSSIKLSINATSITHA